MQDWEFWQTIRCIYVYVLLRVCTHVRLLISETCHCVYFCAVVEGMYTCNTGNFGNEPLCLCLGSCRWYVQI